MDASVYYVPVDPDGDDAHGLTLRMVGNSKRVLEVGCGPGHVTRHLAAHGNSVVGVEIDPTAAARAEMYAERVVVADLDRVDLAKLMGSERFDVIVLADVLEHLRDPQVVLRASSDLLASGGYVVVSVPNVAHIDLRLAHLDGKWSYQETGLLDRTHLRFFTRDGLRQMVRDAGFRVADLQLARFAAFTTNLGVQREAYPATLVDQLLTDPDAETYQFVAKLVPDDADWARNAALDRLATLEDEVVALEQRLAAGSAELNAVRIERDTALAAQPQADPLTAQLAPSDAAKDVRIAELEEQLAAERAHVAALLNTTTYRVAAPLRRVYGSLRSRPQ